MPVMVTVPIIRLALPSLVTVTVLGELAVLINVHWKAKDDGLAVISGAAAASPVPLRLTLTVASSGSSDGIEIVADKTTKRVFDPALNIMDKIKNKALEKGLFIRNSSISSATGDRIEWSCPLVINVKEVDKALDILLPIVANIKPC